jgi:hypothetical protein
MDSLNTSNYQININCSQSGTDITSKWCMNETNFIPYHMWHTPAVSYVFQNLPYATHPNFLTNCKPYMWYIQTVSYNFNAMNSAHFCSITLRSNQMHYFYYLKLKTIYNLSLWYTTNCLQFCLPDMFRRLLRAIFRGVFKPNLLA